MLNARTLRRWLLTHYKDSGVDVADVVSKHVAAVSANVDRELCLDVDHVLVMCWSRVGHVDHVLVMWMMCW